ncbi:GNAT family N-acetyltransferase [Streptomyces caatingaensis]|uniref:GCN5 family acetyltransferase n=1 Tax=Streptomyces caatingaensis TaxID=1678637 RepID=A0A0K9XB98_9ACTN|nr:GCN5 family acetyltransferase [Streptomyces caatingaensis]
MTATLPTRTTTLTGRHIRLEPLVPSHTADLFAAGGGDEDVWRWTRHRTPRTEEEMGAIVARHLAEESLVPFAVVHRDTGRAVGVSCYAAASAEGEQVEIGGTWYGRAHWGSAVNPECKLLMLTHAFEELGMGRVVWKTDHLNERSRRAVARLGAVEEGTFRRHVRRPDGTWRDSVWFSMLRDEWPAAKSRLEQRI